MLCSIFLLEEDGLHLRYAAAPNLPEAFREATDGVPSVLMWIVRHGRLPSRSLSSSPTSLPTRSGPILETSLSRRGLRAAWSSPIMSHDGKLLGTFGMYFREVRHPGPSEIQLIEMPAALPASPSSATDRRQHLDGIRGDQEIGGRIPTDCRRHLTEDHRLEPGRECSICQSNGAGLSRALHGRAMEADFREQVFHPEDLEDCARHGVMDSRGRLAL